MAYNKNTDYKALIDQAAAKGDYRTAAKLEQQRNEKIKGEGMGYSQTSDYSGWLDKNDYGEKIISAVGSGKSKQTVADLLSSRVDKASSTKGMEQWVNDDIYDLAMSYLSSGGQMPEYESRYGDRISALLDKLLEREAFSYDYQSDPLYQAYAEAYQREGRRATEDTLGLAAQNTGGYASSYAAAAAQQAGSYYSSKQADKIPELYKLAYQVYMDEYEADAKNLGLLSGLEQQEYQRYRDQVDDLYRQSQLDYEKYLQELGLSQYEDKLEYDRGRDSIKDQRYQTEWDYKLDRDALADERYNAQQAQKAATASAKTKTSSRKSAAGGKDEEEEVSVYGLTGTYTLSEAEALVSIGMAERFKENGKTFYKLVAIG